MILSRFDCLVARSFFAGAVPVLLGLLGLFSFLGLTEELEDVGQGGFSVVDALLIVMMSLPARVIELAPVSALLGTLIGVGALAHHHEITAMRAAGFSPWRLAVPIAAASVVFAIGLLILQGLLVPGIEQETARLRAKAQTEPGAGAIWMRSRDGFVRISGEVSGRRLQNVEIHEFGPGLAPRRLLLADVVDILDDGSWLLSTVREVQLAAEPPVESLSDRLIWRTSFTREQTETLIVPVQALVLGELRRYIAVLEENGMDSHRHRIQLWQQLSSPLGLIGMALLGMPLLLVPGRSTSIAQRAMLGAAVGIVLFLAQRLCSQGGIIYRLSPEGVALAPGLMLVLVALWLTSRAEGHHALGAIRAALRRGRTRRAHL